MQISVWQRLIMVECRYVYVWGACVRVSERERDRQTDKANLYTTVCALLGFIFES